MAIGLIQVPYHAGDARGGSALGPARLVRAGAPDRLGAGGLGVRVTEIGRGIRFRDSVSTSFAVCRQVAAEVAAAIKSEELPIVLAGGCDISKGVLSGFDHKACGVIWFDAHGDFNTPDSTISGYFPGMSMAVITGHCYQRAWEKIGNATPIAESRVVMLGVRDVDPLELERLESSSISVIRWKEGRPEGDVTMTLDQLAGRVTDVYLHIDMDSLDPSIAPGVVDRPVPGGVRLEQLDAALKATVERFRLRAVTIATYNPERDEDGRTLETGLHILELLGRSLSSSAAPHERDAASR
jgi:arginase